MSTEQWWYLSRITGLTAWALTAAAMVLGLLMTSRTGARGRVRWLAEAHQWASGLSVGLALVHVGALIPERHLDLSIVELMVPFTSTWRPWAVATGIVAFYLLIAVQLTAVARARLPRSWWKSVHRASFVLFWLATLHTSLAGSDAGNRRVVYTVNATVVCVLFLTLVRVLNAFPQEAKEPAR